MKKVIIIGAAGRDFHNFNVYFRQNDYYKVVAFTAAQIPNIDGRLYPPELSGSLYPKGIPIYPETDLGQLITAHGVEFCVFSYSDVPYARVMSLSALVNAAGAGFMLLGPSQTWLESNKPVIAVCAARTGCGKSQTARRVVEILKSKGLKVVAVRYPMPYGDIAQQRVQRFASLADLEKHHCTIEEIEDYEPYIENGTVIYAGVDYEAILRAAEKDPNGCDVILWDGGDNDFPFYKPDLFITVADPRRAGHEVSYYPGEVNLRMADIVIINKIDTATPEEIDVVRKNIARVNSHAVVIDAASPIRIDNPEIIKGKRVLVVEDGPTLTHGEMTMGAGTVAALKYGAAEIVDPRDYAVGLMAETFQVYPNIGNLLPAMGYGSAQIADLAHSINATPCDLVIIGTPMDLNRVIAIDKPNTRVYCDLQEIGHPTLVDVIDELFMKLFSVD